jgi:hypothetical protein
MRLMAVKMRDKGEVSVASGAPIGLLLYIFEIGEKMRCEGSASLVTALADGAVVVSLIISRNLFLHNS